MKDLTINGLSIAVTNAQQIINMGGPWVGDLFVGERKVSDTCIEGNIVVNDSDDQVYFISYHKVSKWQNENYFTINSYHVRTSVVIEFEKRFNMVYIDELTDDGKMEIYLAFHNQDASKKRIFDVKAEKSSPG